jgi:hypothetical protein
MLTELSTREDLTEEMIDVIKHMRLSQKLLGKKNEQIY